MAMTQAEIISMCNEMIKDLGWTTYDSNTQTEVPFVIDASNYGSTFMTQLQALAPDKISNLIKGMFLIAEQRGYRNIWDASKNPYREFLRDLKQEGGWTLQDYMMEILDGMTPYWTSSYTDSQVVEGLVKDYEQKIRNAYHFEPFSKQFATTINEKDYGKYLYAAPFSQFINNKIGNLTDSAEIWLEKSVLIDELKDMITENHVVFKNGYDPNSDIGIKHFIEDIQTVHTAMSQPTALYNSDGIISITPSDEFKFLFIKSSMLNRLKVYIESGAYNLDKVLLPQRIIEVPEDMSLGTVTVGTGDDEHTEEVHALLIDRRALVLGIRTWRITDFFIANKLKRNYFLSVEGIRSHNTFINAVAFTGSALSNFQ